MVKSENLIYATAGDRNRQRATLIVSTKNLLIDLVAAYLVDTWVKIKSMTDDKIKLVSPYDLDLNKLEQIGRSLDYSQMFLAVSKTFIY